MNTQPLSTNLNFNTAVSYLKSVELEYGAKSATYTDFLGALQDFHLQKTDESTVIKRVFDLFKGKPLLLQGFDQFLPTGYTIRLSPANPDGTVDVHVQTPEGVTKYNTKVDESAAAPTPVEVEALSNELRIQSLSSSAAEESVEWVNGHTLTVSPTPVPELPDGYRFHASPPPLDAYLNLRRTSGLTPVSPSQGAKSIKGGWYAVHITYISATQDTVDGNKEEVVAMGRIIGDGGWYFHIVDMAVLPGHQRKGLGGAILGALMQRIKDVAEPGFVCNLFADPPGQKLYARYGFVEPTGERGMMQWVGGKGEKKGEGWWPKKAQEAE